MKLLFCSKLLNILIQIQANNTILVSKLTEKLKILPNISHFSQILRLRENRGKVIYVCLIHRLISSSLSFYHKKAAEALCIGQIQTRLGVAFASKLSVEFSSDFFNLLLARFHQAKVIIVKHFIQGRNNETRLEVEPGI